MSGIVSVGGRLVEDGIVSVGVERLINRIEHFESARLQGLDQRRPNGGHIVSAVLEGQIAGVEHHQKLLGQITAGTTTNLGGATVGLFPVVGKLGRHPLEVQQIPVPLSFESSHQLKNWVTGPLSLIHRQTVNRGLIGSCRIGGVRNLSGRRSIGR